NHVLKGLGLFVLLKLLLPDEQDHVLDLILAVSMAGHDPRRELGVMLATGFPPIVVTPSPFRISRTRDVPAPNALGMGGNAEQFGSLRIDTGEPLAHALRVNDLVRAHGAADH